MYSSWRCYNEILPLQISSFLRAESMKVLHKHQINLGFRYQIYILQKQLSSFKRINKYEVLSLLRISGEILWFYFQIWLQYLTIKLTVTLGETCGVGPIQQRFSLKLNKSFFNVSKLLLLFNYWTDNKKLHELFTNVN